MPDQVSAHNTLAIPASPDDIDVMARTLWGECRGETQEGRTAVAWVIRNRATSQSFAATLAGQEGAVAHVCKAPWQFSCWLSSDPNRAKIDALILDEYADEHDLASDVIDGIVADPTRGAVNYYSPAGMVDGKPPYWAASMTFVGQFGRQLFFR